MDLRSRPIVYEIQERLRGLVRRGRLLWLDIKQFDYTPPHVTFEAKLVVSHHEFGRGDRDQARVRIYTDLTTTNIDELQACAEGSHFGWIRGCIPIGDLLNPNVLDHYVN